MYNLGETATDGHELTTWPFGCAHAIDDVMMGMMDVLVMSWTRRCWQLGRRRVLAQAVTTTDLKPSALGNSPSARVAQK